MESGTVCLSSRPAEISGEALIRRSASINVSQSVAEEIKQVTNSTCRWQSWSAAATRGISKSAGKVDRSSADYIGMLATVMNAVVLRMRWKIWASTPVLSAIDVPQLAEPFIRRRAIRHLEKADRHFCSWHWQSVLSTDSAAALRSPKLKQCDSQSHQG